MALAKTNGRHLFWLAVGLFLAGCTSPHGELTITNLTDSVIAPLTIDVCGQRFAFENVPAGEYRQIEYKVSCESHYSVSAMFPDGKHMAEQIGYVTPGLAMSHRIVIKRDGIVFEVR
jgi:hypothetical protein